MSEQDIVVTPEKENKESVGNPVVTPATETTPEKSEEALQLEVRKAELEEEVRGLEGTVTSLKEDIVRKRQERKGVEEEEQQPPIDKEALLAEMEERNKALIQPVLEENEKLRKQVLESNEKTLKAKQAQLDSINARIASATASSSAKQTEAKTELEVELSAAEAKIAQELGLKNPRYMKETEVL